MRIREDRRFWLGNVVMAVALVILLMMGTLWQYLGVWAMGLWVIVTGIGGFLLSSRKGDSSGKPN